MTIAQNIRRACSALAVSAALAAPAVAGAQVREVANRGPVVTITRSDLDSSNAKVAMAYNDLVATWGRELQQMGARFAAPDIVRYRNAIRTSCGVMSPSNAAYCPSDNTIYYDELFVAGLQRRTADALGTDGDMAAVGVIAHEMGHAVAIQLGDVSRYTYDNEARADCLAGAFAQKAQQAGELEKGDLDEAFYGMSTAGDPTPQLTGNGRMDRFILARAALMGHGTREQRMQNFRTGLDRGARACLETRFAS
jgi:predicted metalloprotease